MQGSLSRTEILEVLILIPPQILKHFPESNARRALLDPLLHAQQDPLAAAQIQVTSAVTTHKLGQKHTELPV